MTSQITKLGMGLGLILLSCTGSADETVCDDSPISLELPSIDSDVVLFGELHGNRESPEVFLAAICQYLLSEDRKVRVALEFPTEMQQSLEIFMESDGDRDAVLQFLSQPFWQENRGDGRSSVAMLTLVDQLRQLRTLNQRLVSVTAVDGWWMNRPIQYSGIDRDSVMGANIASLAQEFDDDVVFVLVGNIHARRTPPAGMNFLSPAGSLVEGELLNVLILPESGESWNCRGVCQSWPVSEVTDLLAVKNQIRTEGSYDYVLPIGRVTSSPPANHMKR